MLETDNTAVGRLAGEFLGSALAASSTRNPDHTQLVILEAPDTAYSNDRVDGFLATLRTRAPGIDIAARIPGGAQRASSLEAITNYLQTTEPPDAIFSVTDSGAYGAIRALSAAGIAPESVIIVSVNAESLALDEIYNGHYLRASVDIRRESGSRGAVDAIVKMLGGGTLPEILMIPSARVISRSSLDEQAPNE
jgi:ABC-type sugar transport system substrate-binding protein